MNRARGFGALSVALGLSFVACGGDGGSGDDDAGEAGSAGSSSGKGGGAGKGGSAGQAGKGGSTGTAGSNAGNSGTSGRGGSAGSGGSAGEAGANGGQGGTDGGDGGVPSEGGRAQAGASSGGNDSGGDDAGGASGDASGGQATGGDGSGAGGAGGERVAGGASGNDQAGGEGGQDDAGGAGGNANAPVIVVFDGGTSNTGATWSGRSGLDTLCQSAKTAQSIAGATPHALISVSPSDDIADFPALYGLPTNRAFASVSGAVIADDFADLLDGTLDLSIDAAGILLSEPGLWFTGSNADGTASANTCEGWTTTVHSNEIRANYGYTDTTGSWWLDGSATATCTAGQYHILCVTWE